MPLSHAKQQEKGKLVDTSLPSIKSRINTIEGKMERELDKEAKLKKGA